MKDEHGFEVPISRTGASAPVAPALLKRISWGAIFAGVVIALAVQIVLSLLGIGIGASTIDPLSEQHPGKGLGIGAAIWFVISSLIATFAGAWVAGRLSGATRTTDGTLHGVLTWAASTLLTMFLLTSAVGGIIGGAAGLMSKALGAAGNAASSSDAQAQLRNLGIDPDALKQQAQSVVPGAPTGRPQGDAQQTEQQKQQIEQKAREAGDTAARGVAKAAFWSFVMLVLSAAAAAYGGNRGTPGYMARRVETAPAV